LPSRRHAFWIRSTSSAVLANADTPYKHRHGRLNDRWTSGPARCQRQRVGPLYRVGSTHWLRVRPDIRGYRCASGRKATCSRLTDVVTSMSAKADFETLDLDFLERSRPCPPAGRCLGWRPSTTTEDLWFKTVDLGSYLGNRPAEGPRFWARNLPKTEVIWLIFRKLIEFLYS
jgi:hypothetical protein